MESKDSGAFRGRRSSWLLAILFTLLTVSSSKAQVFHTLLSFPGGTLGADPPTRSLVAGSGNFFGATSQGGDTSCDPGFGCGVIYQLTSSGTETVLHSFTGATGNDGAQPNAPALNSITHELEGTTSGGGSNTAACPNGCGTAYTLSNGNEAIVHIFTGSPDANLPLGTSIIDSAGNLYGVSFYGGGSTGETGAGTVFTINSAGQLSLLYRFTAPPDGTNPNGSLARDAAGNLFGTTTYGGSGTCNNGFLPGCGTVFEVDSAGNESILHSFTGGSDSRYPGSLVMDASRNLFGVASNNGASGVIFKLDSSGNFSVIDSAPIAGQIANLVLGPSGSFFVTVNPGGTSCPSGCVAQLKPSGKGYKTVLLHAFNGSDGSEPDSLVLNKGALYGTTFQGGNANDGTVFEITQQ